MNEQPIQSAPMIGERLLDAKLISEEQLSAAIDAQQKRERGPSRLGETLCETGVITPEQLNTALETQKQQPKSGFLGETLCELGLITKDQLEIALKEQQQCTKERVRLGETLCELGFISESVLSEYLAGKQGKRFIDVTSILPDPEMLKIVPDTLAKRFRLLPVGLENDVATVAMADVTNIVAIDRLRTLFGRQIRVNPVAAAPEAIDAAIDAAYGGSHNIGNILKEIETGQVDMAVVAERGQYAHPIVRLVETLLVEAIKHGASDIHFEPEGRILRVRLRIDGELTPIHTLHADYWPPVALRLKLLASLNIAETRVPQDGRIQYHIGNREIDFRVATIPTIHGESITLRILDKNRAVITLPELGFSARNLVQVDHLLSRPEGIILLTGPTGSGKTSTLYSMLKMVNNPSQKIVTLEDPVEYTLPLLQQTNIHEEAGLTFGAGVRSLMRHDPDIMLVGEIRDEDTAIMAIRSAMTGHKVFSTLHANSAVHSFARLVDVGAPRSLIPGAVIGIIAQRLVRRLCPKCRIQVPMPPEDIERLGRGNSQATFCRVGPGCQACRGKGYRGRIAVSEVLTVNEAIDDLVARAATPAEILLAAKENGFRPMVEDGIDRLQEGVVDRDDLAEHVRF